MRNLTSFNQIIITVVLCTSFLASVLKRLVAFNSCSIVRIIFTYDNSPQQLHMTKICGDTNTKLLRYRIISKFLLSSVVFIAKYCFLILHMLIYYQEKYMLSSSDYFILISTISFNISERFCTNFVCGLLTQDLLFHSDSNSMGMSLITIYTI